MTTAVVLYNLGGPDGPDDVRPFLFNLFNDPMIIGAPAPIRWALAQLISRRRAPIAQEIYAHIGGGSPLLANTRAQADALEAVLNTGGGEDFKCFVAMRYWHPMCDAVMDEVIASAPERIVLLPLYPQFSTTTVGSMMRIWERVARKRKLDIPVTALCCYPTDSGFIGAVTDLLADALEAGTRVTKDVRILFSAHGLPKQIVEGGDPYQSQVEQTAAAVMNNPAMESLGQELDWLCCYQSRVGPLEWIGPSTDDEIARAGADGKSVIIVPIAFVSEHSETLVELDIEYRALAEGAGVPEYIRVQTVGTAPKFIAGLADLVRGNIAAGCDICSGNGGRVCSGEWSKCPMPAAVQTG
ncbi:MAG: ferrochelatase [Rhodospirillaceae bacterium]|jgi:ferrochelatase|nr:ferrochelatase [Rhodospirillaceae bacterium]MBT3931858.1 ferrochelatase [Rhodospirillaceae bacterium]MBT4772530.1 ferrochelatase [Rhodospirillaceae bacterium]MBT5358120.1 ferrochelatase [Rhodospirillaceae bacterium]MBT5769361.1 ferrochelatase [Rhodospirillaceae bacterium]